MIKLYVYGEYISIPYPEKDLFVTIESKLNTISGINKKLEYLHYCKGEVLKIIEFKKAKKIEKMPAIDETGKLFFADTECMLHGKELDDIREYLSSLILKVDNEIELIKTKIPDKDNTSDDIVHLKREKAFIQSEFDKLFAEDGRKPKRKCEDYIDEYLHNEKYDAELTKTELAKKIKKWIFNTYHKTYSIQTIRPKLSDPI
jgi:hypothetical protein